jgi:ribosomal protein L18
MKERSGRVFVVRDEKKIIAQAWLWRNGNTICFDNLEIAKKSNTYENQTAVYDILKKVAKELCDKDSEVVDRLVEEGKIITNIGEANRMAREYKQKLFD